MQTTAEILSDLGVKFKNVKKAIIAQFKDKKQVIEERTDLISAF